MPEVPSQPSTASNAAPQDAGSAAQVTTQSTTPPATTPPAAPVAAAAPAPAPKRKLRLLALAVILVAGGGAGAWYLLNTDYEKTDNAQVDGDIVAIRAQTAGVVAKVLFRDNQLVEAGQVLIEIDPQQHEVALREVDAKLAEAKANLAAAIAEVKQLELIRPGEVSAANAAFMQARAAVAVAADDVRGADVRFREGKRDVARAEELFERKAMTQLKLEQTRSALEAADATLRAAQSKQVQAQARQREMQANREKTGALEPRTAEARARQDAAQARVSVAEAARARAEIDMRHTKVVSPVRGIASKRVVADGQLLTAGQPIVTIVRVDDLWVTAHFKETQIGRMKAGNLVEISVDAYDGTTIDGELESMAAATGARFSLLPPDNATGNFTKVVQRVPVRIKVTKWPDGFVLRPGMSVEVKVDVTREAKQSSSTAGSTPTTPASKP